jgi:tRNA (guanine26-N2/guanine27-N2)-dimethyltransferase
VLLARQLGLAAPLRVLDLMTGCGIRALRYGQESPAALVWANDADPDRQPLLQANLAPLADRPGLELRCTALTAQQLLAGCLQRQERFELVDLDAFGCPTALLPLALEAVAFGGVLYVASTDGRSPTGHDRSAAVRTLGAAARAHPASWELALRLQLGVIARTAWAMGRGLQPLFGFSEGRTFRTAARQSDGSSAAVAARIAASVAGSCSGPIQSGPLTASAAPASQHTCHWRRRSRL